MEFFFVDDPKILVELDFSVTVSAAFVADALDVLCFFVIISFPLLSVEVYFGVSVIFVSDLVSVSVTCVAVFVGFEFFVSFIVVVWVNISVIVGSVVLVIDFFVWLFLSSTSSTSKKII